MKKELIVFLCLALVPACNKSDNPAEQAKDSAEHAIGAAKELAEQAKVKAEDLARQANEAMGEALDQASDQVGEVTESAENARRNTQLKASKVSPLIGGPRN